jgi:hypothetical protein
MAEKGVETVKTEINGDSKADFTMVGPITPN